MLCKCFFEKNSKKLLHFSLRYDIISAFDTMSKNIE